VTGNDTRKALASCLRTLARNSHLAVSFNDRPGTVGFGRVSVEADDAGRAPMAVVRGRADALALRLRYPAAEGGVPLPADPAARAFLDGLNAARVESLGARAYPGIASNLAARWEAPPLGLPGMVAAERLRQLACPAQLPPGAGDWISEHQAVLTPLAERLLVQLVDALADAEAASRLAQALMQELLDLPPAVREAPDEADPRPAPEQDTAPTPRETPTDEDTSSHAEPQQTAEAAPEAGRDSAAESATQTGRTAAPAVGLLPPELLPTSRQDDSYRVFTRRYDETVRAGDLASLAELQSLRLGLDRQLQPYRQLTLRLANRLLRRLLAQQDAGWQMGQEEGFLDPRRLPQIVIDPNTPAPFRRPAPVTGPDTVVSLLIDNSGSMRGQPIALAAMTADVIAMTLERCRIKTEVLGFTTRTWRGGRVMADWVQAGKPAHPGRLNELRHIIYKAASQPWRQARTGMGLMLREGLLKENIDGEALLWAYGRLLQRPERRRILIVLSDGAPVDDATLSANYTGYLEVHLRQVIQMIEARGAVELTAIGIGHDVWRTYRRAITIADPRDLAAALLERLEQLFTV
jgi:cobaltochelatase CobT